MSESRMRKRFLDCKGLTIEQAESYARGLCEQQRDVMFQLGDLYRYCAARWPDTHFQVWPEWRDPGVLQRAAGVCRAYPQESDRQHEVSYTQYMQVAGEPDRQERLAATADKGQTSDESRQALKAEKEYRWLLCIDVHFHLHKHWFSGAGVEAASRVSEWIQRLVERLKLKGLTDCVCCFDSKTSFRKELTKDWEDRYKDRPPKDPQLIQQLQLVRELLHQAGFYCASADGFESDDVLASYAAQFPGNVTIVSQDKDLRQCLSPKCNILLDVEWVEDEQGDLKPEYKWLSQNDHIRDTGISPEVWADYQCIWGDTTDNVKGAVGIGEKGAKDLIQHYGSLEAVLKAAADGDEFIKPKKREALKELAERVDVMKQLVTMRTDVPVAGDTRV